MSRLARASCGLGARARAEVPAPPPGSMVLVPAARDWRGLRRLRLAAAAALLVAGFCTGSQAAPKRPAAAALSFARGAGMLVPAGAEGALLLDGAAGTAGLRAYLGAAGAWAAALRPEPAGGDLARALSLDPLSAEASAQAGLAADGPRAVVLGTEAIGYTAPVADAAQARRALEAWLSQLGPPRQTRQAPLKGPLASGAGGHARAGMIAPVAGGLRLLTASGRGATALVAALAHLGPRPADTLPLGLDPALAAALDEARAPAVLWLRGRGAVLATVLSLTASARGISAAGLLLPAGKEKLFEGAAPEAACEAAVLCARASLGRAAVALLSRALPGFVARSVPASARDAFFAQAQAALAHLRGPSALQVDRFDATALATSRPGDAADWLARAATRELPPPPAAAKPGTDAADAHAPCLQSQADMAWLAAPCPESAPPPLAAGTDPALLFAARLDTSAVGAALGRLSALDALRGELPATAFALQLLWGPLLVHAGPLTLRGRAVPNLPGAAALELDFPLQQR